MDEAMISLWNQRVNHDDNVYILGDFCYRNEKSAEWYLSQLKGHKHLVLGNHDTRLLDNEIAMGYCDSIDRIVGKRYVCAIIRCRNGMALTEVTCTFMVIFTIRGMKHGNI